MCSLVWKPRPGGPGLKTFPHMPPFSPGDWMTGPHEQVIEVVNNSLNSSDMANEGGLKEEEEPPVAEVLEDDMANEGSLREPVAEVLEEIAPPELEKDEDYEADFEDVTEVDVAPVNTSHKSLFGRTVAEGEHVAKSGDDLCVAADNVSGVEEELQSSGQADSQKPMFGRTVTLNSENQAASCSPEFAIDTDCGPQSEYAPDFEEDAPAVQSDMVETVESHESAGMGEMANQQEEAIQEAVMPADASAKGSIAMEPSITSDLRQEVSRQSASEVLAFDGIEGSNAAHNQVEVTGKSNANAVEDPSGKDKRRGDLVEGAESIGQDNFGSAPTEEESLNICNQSSSTAVAKVDVQVPRRVDEDARSQAVEKQSEMRSAQRDERVAGHRSSAEVLLQKGESTSALEELSEVIHLMPEDPVGYSMRATAFLQAGKVSEAIRDLQVASNLDPGDAKMFLRLAHLCVGTGDLETGLEAIRSGHAAHPENEELLHLLNEYSLSPAKRWVPDSRFKEEDSGSGPVTRPREIHADEINLATDGRESGKDYQWQRKTLSGRFFTPITSTVRTIEARQRKIREKCVQINRKKEQKLIGQRRKAQDAAAEEARIAQMEAKKAQVTRQLDIVHDCLQVIDNEKLIQYGKAPASNSQRRSQRSMPRFTQTEDVVAEILLYLDREIPMDRDPRGYEHPSVHLLKKAEIVQDAVNHVTALSMQPVKVHNQRNSNSLRDMSSTIAQLAQQPTTASRHDLASPSMSIAETASPLSSGSCTPDLYSTGKLPDIRQRSATMARLEVSGASSGEEQLASIPPFQQRGSAPVKFERKTSSSLSTLSESMVERLSSLASQASQRSSNAAEDGDSSSLTMDMADGGGGRTIFSSLGTRTGTRAGRPQESSSPSYTKLPMKTHSSSLSHACGLATRGGFS